VSCSFRGDKKCEEIARIATEHPLGEILIRKRVVGGASEVTGDVTDS